MEKLVILMCLFAAIVALPTQDWNTFKMIHSKKYQNDREEKSRMNIFLEHQNEVNKHNEMYEKGLVSYKMILNAFSDMTYDEFAKQKNGFNHPGGIQLKKTIQSSVLLKLPSIALPKSVDWRDKGAVTDVKDQLDCGSCWAFSTVGVLEGQYFLKHGRLQSLAAQNLVDCAKTQRNKCSGFQRHAAFDYIKRNGGIETDKSYPYKGYGGSCKYSKRDNSGVTLRDYEYIPEGDEEKLQAAIASKGPISVSIDASHKSFQFYSSGIYYEPKCNSNNLDHAVLVVGYGTDKNGREYYIVKNSYGQKWGENGYARLARNRKNHCGIASSAVYPVL